MKSLIVLFAFFTTVSANAFYRVECNSNNGVTPKVELNVDLFQPLSADLTVTENGKSDFSHFFNLQPNRYGLYNITLWTGDFNLSIDTWPDNAPMFGRDYNATLLTSKVQNGARFDQLECSFY